MSGRITSKESGINHNGVAYAKELQLLKESKARLIASMRRALEAWQFADKATKNSQEKRRLLREARRQTEIALS